MINIKTCCKISGECFEQWYYYENKGDNYSLLTPLFLAFVHALINDSFLKIFAQKDQHLFPVNEGDFDNLVISTRRKKHRSHVDRNSGRAKSALAHRRNILQIGGCNVAT